ncbi:MAG: CoA transferase [Desulfobacterales bacterium]|nr:CoA transferase [Desulfobacterales bacterium]
MSNRGSLNGIKVLDLSRMLPGPYCSMILADHGAEVIAIEDHRFRQDGLFFNTINRNKQHLALNLKTIEGKDIFFKLAESADVIIEGFRPGVVKRLGVDYETVSDCNPGIIYCAITGYGQTGSFKDRAGHDVNYLSTAGILELVGPETGPPTIPGVQFADIAGGSMNAVVGILLALYHRKTTGKGQYIDISMTDGLLGYLSLPHFFRLNAGKEPQRSQDLLSHRYACYNTYETADGGFIAIGAVENRFWKQLCEMLGVPDYSELQYDEHRRMEIITTIRTIFKMKSVDEWDEFLGVSDVCYSRVYSLKDVLHLPLFLEREMVVPVTNRDGTVSQALGIPVKMSESPGSIRTPPDSFGESSEVILRGLGYTPEQIRDFRRDGIV